MIPQEGNLILGVEGGGTRTRVLLADAQGFILAREYGGTASSLYVDPEQYRAKLEGMFRKIVSSTGVDARRVSMAGFAGPMDPRLLHEAVRASFGEIPIRGFSESAIALACHGLTWGVSLVAGTGASCRAINEQGEARSCGGYGPQFGDEGSGYWIGREAIAAVMRERDGRGPVTLLSHTVCAKLELTDIWGIFRRADRSGHVPGPVIASLTPLVYEAATGGDAAALDICARAGSHLASLAGTTVRLMSFSSAEIPLVLSGGVFAGKDLIMTSFARTLEELSVPQVIVYPPLTEVSDGLIHCLLRVLAEDGNPADINL